MDNTVNFYQANAVQTEVVHVNNKAYFVYLPMSESQFFCPGFLVEKIDNKSISIRFIRQSINNKNTQGMNQAKYVSDWNKEQHSDKTIINGKLSISPFAQYFELPTWIERIVTFQNDRAINLQVRQ